MTDSKNEYRLDPPSQADQKPPVYPQQGDPQQFSPHQSYPQQFSPQQSYPQQFSPPQSPPQQGYFAQQPYPAQQIYPPTQQFSPQPAYPQQLNPVLQHPTGSPAQYPGYQQPVFQSNVPQQAYPMNIGDAYRANLFAGCAQGLHTPRTEYGVAGILVAIFFFPIGLIALCVDRRRKCDRCGVALP